MLALTTRSAYKGKAGFFPWPLCHANEALTIRALTYMATIDDAVGAGSLVAFELPDWDRRLPIRPLWITPELCRWADETPELHDMALAVGRRTLFEHLLQLFCDFRCLERFHAGDLRRMMPNNKGVWKMHPARLRIYGWCPGQHQFVAVTYALEADTKSDRRLNNQKRDEVLTFIRANHLERTILRGDVLAVFPNPN
jgi:hypothetical protein